MPPDSATPARQGTTPQWGSQRNIAAASTHATQAGGKGPDVPMRAGVTCTTTMGATSATRTVCTETTDTDQGEEGGTRRAMRLTLRTDQEGAICAAGCMRNSKILCRAAGARQHEAMRVRSRCRGRVQSRLGGTAGVFAAATCASAWLAALTSQKGRLSNEGRCGDVLPDR